MQGGEPGEERGDREGERKKHIKHENQNVRKDHSKNVSGGKKESKEESKKRNDWSSPSLLSSSLRVLAFSVLFMDFVLKSVILLARRRRAGERRAKRTARR
jgi:hypothetical protein